MSQEVETLATASQRVGTVLHGKYRLDGVLGVGGMATVYAATHRNRKRFAVKMLHTELSVRSDVRARFVREGYVANSVPHPGVVAVLDDDVDETGAAFLVMELLDGVTVDALYTRGGPVPVREALGIVHQLLDVLDAAHRQSVVHRDIKPANLFILRDGQLKVLDFGIARLRESDAALKSTRDGVLLGTPAFMAPEQALAMPENVDERTDVWAAGATLFTMLSACFVHPGENGRQIMIRAATEPARSLEAIMPELPPAVTALVSRALAFERAQRWPSAAAMRDAVLDIFNQLFDSPPVRADVARLVERTSATLASQATEIHPFTESQRLRAGRHPSRAFQGATAPTQLPSQRAPETAMSTPVAALGRASGSLGRWAPLTALSGAAALAMAAFLTLRSATRTSNPTPAFVQSPSNVARDNTPLSPEFKPTPEPSVALSREAGDRAASEKISPPVKSAGSAARLRPPSRRLPQVAAAAPSAVAPSTKPENPLALELQ